MSGRRALFSVAALWASGFASGWTIAATPPPPGLDPAGLKAWAQYQKEPAHRAFAIAPGGQWGWRSGLADTEQASDEALAACQQENERPCLSYDLNGRKVLTSARWEQALTPYPATLPDAPTQVGTRRAQRFPDLRLQTPEGVPVPLAQAGSHITVLHFWGSWCPPCVKELPNLELAQKQLAQKQLAKDREIRFVVVPLRESMATSQAWLKSRKLRLQLTLAETASATALRLRDGKTLPDRQVAPVFPTTYLLDGRGTVLFVQHGPIHDWASLLPILRHAARYAN